MRFTEGVGVPVPRSLILMWRFPLSLRLDAEILEQFLPLGEVRAQEGGEFRRLARDDLGSLGGELLAHLRRREDLGELAAEERQDFRRRRRRREDAVPSIRLV